ncbi:MAG: cupredoxin domain-containing protein [Acidobacteriota bacterium]
MKSKLFLTTFAVIAFALGIASCRQNNPSASNNSISAPPAEIKRTDLTENAQFSMDLAVEPKALSADQEVVLKFSVKDKDGKPFDELKVVHEKLIHLLVVSDDLAQFDHVHPERQTDGTFTLSYKFPNGGIFKLYADFTPENSEQIVNVFDVTVSGHPREKTALVADTNFTKTIDGLTFTMKATEPIKAATGTELNFYVTDEGGKAVSDLQPYLGAMAHFVVISEDTTKFLHVHAMEGKTTDIKGTGGHGDHSDKHGEMDMHVKPVTGKAQTPTVMAHTEFPTGGLYKIWGQFQRNGKVFTVPFILNVAPADGKTAKGDDVPGDAFRVEVSSDGFVPSEIPVKKGQPVKIAFYRKDANNCAGEVVFPKLNIKKALPVGKTTVVEINPIDSGEIAFACGMDMLKGKVIVQ